MVSSLDRYQYESRLHAELEPIPNHSQPRVHHAYHTSQNTAKGPQAGHIQQIIMPQYTTTTVGSTNQHVERNDAVANTHPRSYPCLVFHQSNEKDGWNCDEDAAEGIHY